MSKPKKYHIELKNSERQISQAWSEIQRKSEFHDVTLACDEDQLNAHKVILSSFSPVLQKILTRNYHKHPLIYLRGISYSILTNIIDFIYKGEVSIAQETVKEFLSVANELRIKGLTEDDRQESVSVNVSEPDFFENYIDNANSSNPLQVEYIQNVADQREDIKTEEEDNNETKKDENEDILFLYHCEECDHKTNYRNNLKKHISMQHQGLRYFCEKCDYSSKTQTILKQHVDSKHLGVKYSCNQCDHTGTEKGNLKRHIATQHEGKRHSCDKCEQSYAQKYHLMEHIKSKHEGFRYICKYCNKNYMEKPNLKKHIISQHKDENIGENDGKIASQHNDENTEENYRKMTSPLKDKNAAENAGNFVSRQKEENAAENDGKTFACDKCGKQFAMQAELVKHINVVHNEIRYPCDQCEFKSSSKSNLRKHISSKHDGIRYYCDQCDHKSTQRSHLKVHVEQKHKGPL